MQRTALKRCASLCGGMRCSCITCRRGHQVIVLFVQGSQDNYVGVWTRVRRWYVLQRLCDAVPSTGAGVPCRILLPRGVVQRRRHVVSVHDCAAWPFLRARVCGCCWESVPSCTSHRHRRHGLFAYRNCVTRTLYALVCACVCSGRRVNTPQAAASRARPVPRVSSVMLEARARERRLVAARHRDITAVLGRRLR